jgi:hypothetical protein
LREDVITFAQMADEVQALFKETDDVMAGPHGKQLDGYVGAAIDDEVREASRPAAPSSANADRGPARGEAE